MCALFNFYVIKVGRLLYFAKNKTFQMSFHSKLYIKFWLVMFSLFTIVKQESYRMMSF